MANTNGKLTMLELLLPSNSGKTILIEIETYLDIDLLFLVTKKTQPTHLSEDLLSF